MLDILEKILENPEPVPYIGSGSGVLRSRLIELFCEQLEDEVDPDAFEAVLSDLSVSFQPAWGEPGGEMVFHLFCERLDSGEKWKFKSLPISLLGDEELGDMAAQVGQTVPENYFEGDGVLRPGQAILRKGEGSGGDEEDDGLEGLVGLGEARKSLRVSAKWLKEWIPCTTWREVEGEEGAPMRYYWSSVLIEMLIRIKKASRATRKQREYISKECCYDDDIWAGEIIGALKKL